VLAAIGNMSQALGLVESLNDRKIQGLIGLAQNCADQQTAASLLDRARDLALEPTIDTYAQSLELRDLVSAFLRANRADEASKLLPRIKDEYQLRTSAIAVAEVFLRARRFVEAEEALDVARKKAEKIVSEKSDDIPAYASSSRVQTKSHILSALVDNYILVGSLDSAELAANAIDHPQYEASALSKIAEALAAKGEQSKARGFLRRALELSMKSKEYNHDRMKEEALFDISCAMNKAGLHSEFVTAVNRFLEQLEKSELVDQFAAHLFILGDLADSSGITLNSKSVALLKKIEAQAGN
jgi:tetratricopeptide (TPR) repeat protein